MGENGIRAGWGLLLFVMIFFAVHVVSGPWCSFLCTPNLRPGRRLTPRLGLISEGLQLFCVFVATAVMALIEKRPVLYYGYKGTARAARFFFGLVWGFVAISALVLTLWKAGLLGFDGQLLHGGGMWKYAAEWGLMFLLVGLFEESLTRGYVQFTMTRGVGFWWGALVFSFLFGFGHGSNPGESPVGSVFRGRSRSGLLPEPLVHGIIVVGGGISRGVGLGRIIFLRHFGQRHDRARAFAG